MFNFLKATLFNSPSLLINIICCAPFSLGVLIRLFSCIVIGGDRVTSFLMRMPYWIGLPMIRMVICNKNKSPIKNWL